MSEDMALGDSSVHAEVSAYVQKLAGRAVTFHEALISSHLLESIAAVALVEFIEGRFGVLIDDHELVLSNFDSVDAIVALIATKKTAI